ncbi:MAG: RIP metalloprotease RseP [Planctomycetaceae bacterium]|nr:RIP metalloprotease RseP [Planctomycetaceae bacterium]MBT6484565.1 RIP metalloprotease RseP [Planctomycetaceae bacterium]MBT6495511.1 RIP metalloprotease RseP [Planctomycetaceae bacterium]
MDPLIAVDPLFAMNMATFLNIFWVAFGLTWVIIFHEFGHFAVAKLCDVQVERFSIGFGPILLRYKKGETEYALSVIPFGGYVKMLGQDDADPSQMSAEEIAEDPRSYSAKTVLQRMGIISAGVIMNVVTGLLFFASGFALGVEEPDAIIGQVEIGLPAWQAGVEVGDRFTKVNGREIEVFSDVSRAVALSAVDTLVVEGVHRDGKPFKFNIQTDGKSTRPQIGVSETVGMHLIDPGKAEIPVTIPGSSAATADQEFEAGDTIVRIDDVEVSTFPQLQDLLARKRAETLEFHVQRKGTTDVVAIKLKPRRFRTLGLWMGIGKVTAIKDNSPAANQGLKEGDKIAKVDGLEVGTQINPLRLPNYFADKHGQDVEVVVQRPVKGGEPQELTLKLTPLDRPGWIEKPDEGQSVSVPALGVAFQLTSTVLNVVADSPVAGKIKVEERIQKMELILPKGAPSDGYGDKPIVIEFDKKREGDDKETIHNWAYAFWSMQRIPMRSVKLHVSSPGEGGTGKPRVVTLQPKPIDDEWYLPTRGVRLARLMKKRKAESVTAALSMGLTHTKNNMTDIYLTLRSLFGGRISVKELHGPIGIATVAYRVASRGFADLLLFLGFLSVNLAVINFLPIPVLDGGHMVFLIWEGVTRKKPSERVLIAATYAGMAVVLGLMVLVLYLDIFVHWLPGQ